MDNLFFEIIKIVSMAAALIVARYLIPWIKTKIGADKLSQIEKWTKYAVEMAQQVHQSESGADKKAIVEQFLQEMLAETNISITCEQLDILIEAAVKEMKMQESTAAEKEA